MCCAGSPSAGGTPAASPRSAPAAFCSPRPGCSTAGAPPPHWRRCAELARRYPAVHVESDPIFVRDGDFWTSAGVTAGIDLALAFVEADLGRAAALSVARQLVVFAKRPGGQAQFSAGLALATDPDFDALHTWMAGNLHQDLSVPRLADRAGMSERSFARRYRAATGTTPSRAVERLRRRGGARGVGNARGAQSRTSRGAAASARKRRCAAASCRMLAVAPRDYRQRFPARPVPVRGGVHVVQGAQQGDAPAGEVGQRVGQRELGGPAHRGERSRGTARRHCDQPIAAVCRWTEGGLRAAEGAEGCARVERPGIGDVAADDRHAAVAKPPEGAMHADAEVAACPGPLVARGQAGGTVRGLA